MRRCAAFSLLLLFSALAFSIAPRRAHSQGECCAGSPLGPPQVCNVIWIPADSIAGCPAGDSLQFSHPSQHNAHPRRLRIWVHYEDNFCNPRVGVPPESIFVTYSIPVGNLRLNDKGTKVFADDSTDVMGDTWITLPSFSGCGTIRLTLNVSGKAFSPKDRVVRTVDANADGRITSGDADTPCDFNYSGTTGDTTEARLRDSNHAEHWHRHLLHGTQVRRTNACELSSCPSGSVVLGASDHSWSPPGNRLVFSLAELPSGFCRLYIVPTDPRDGNGPIQFTSPPPDSDDYDPSWSPLASDIFFQRGDDVIYRKPVNGDPEVGVFARVGPYLTFPQVSPNGQVVAFVQGVGSPGAIANIFTVPSGGGSATQITVFNDGNVRYPKWSPDGSQLVFERKTATSDTILMSVATTPPYSLQTVYGGSDTRARLPAYSPDGKVAVAGVRVSGLPYLISTVDATVSGAAPLHIENYREFAGEHLGPRWSGDGTRTAVKALTPGSTQAKRPQLWASRRNMSLPPQITQVGTQGVHDTTATTAIYPAHGLPTTVQVLASDPEGDALTCRAFFLQDGMVFDTTTCTLNWTPSAPVGSKFYVKFQVSTNTWPKASGGTDGIITVFTVIAPPPLPTMSRSAMTVDPSNTNLTRGRIALAVPPVQGSTATISIFDLSGRKVAVLRGAPGTQLVWEGTDVRGEFAPPGVYLYRMEAGMYRQEGKVVLVR